MPVTRREEGWGFGGGQRVVGAGDGKNRRRSTSCRQGGVVAFGWRITDSVAREAKGKCMGSAAPCVGVQVLVDASRRSADKVQPHTTAPNRRAGPLPS